MAQGDLPAHHYLGIYRIKLAMAEHGTSEPSSKGITFIRQVVGSLERLESNTPIRFETIQGLVRFKSAQTGELLAEVQIEEHAL